MQNAKCKIQNAPSPNLNFRMNTSLLKDGDLKCALYLVRMYNKCGNNKVSNFERWNQNIATWISLCKVVGKKKAKDTKATEMQLHNSLQVAESELKGDPENATLTCQLIRAKNDLRKLQNQKIKGWRARAKLNWLDSGDRGSVFFFQMFKMKQARENIDSIWEDNKNLSEPNEIIECFAQYYKQLFSAEPVSEKQENARKLIMSLVPKLLDKEDSRILQGGFSKEEIKEAIDALSNVKSPGPNGFPVEFYKDNVEWIMDDLHELYSEAIHKGSMRENIN